jgi:hypothetical protein
MNGDREIGIHSTRGGGPRAGKDVVEEKHHVLLFVTVEAEQINGRIKVGAGIVQSV